MQSNERTMSILIDTVRIYGFRGLKNIEVPLSTTTVITGTNSSGKTTLLKAIQVLFGNTQFISEEDFYTATGENINRITIDARLVPIDAAGRRTNIFDENWETLFTEERIRIDDQGRQFIPIRANVIYDDLKKSFKCTQHIQQEWVPFLTEGGEYWYDSEVDTEKGF